MPSPFRYYDCSFIFRSTARSILRPMVLSEGSESPEESKPGFSWEIMKQHYFVVVLAHSLHGRLRRIHIPHQALYVVLVLALFGSFSLFGMVSSYLRMTWKVANYNTLRTEVDKLRTQYHALQRENDQKNAQLAELQLLASEVTLALGLKGTV